MGCAASSNLVATDPTSNEDENETSNQPNLETTSDSVLTAGNSFNHFIHSLNENLKFKRFPHTHLSTSPPPPPTHTWLSVND